MLHSSVGPPCRPSSSDQRPCEKPVTTPDLALHRRRLGKPSDSPPPWIARPPTTKSPPLLRLRPGSSR
ncbi:hypothetical protein M6B38_279880 [Iris pallida]|uniref:Uncharacterized protein n=1 Tax=Iris pallida TaxID=29817 RepID=A0AAX6HY01_IRIPA|nr:hypothetical protein M6B38_279880 [Iris pallida]